MRDELQRALDELSRRERELARWRAEETTEPAGPEDQRARFEGGQA